ncbi:PGF-pre-PGF domain-containing protein [Natronomonas amylolytica]|uniref:PGF-pre-PGF domain-containing protein n=1 Tax=Natronomonas amylolytica TaxID=3108498 RepID=UPI00300B6DB2
MTDARTHELRALLLACLVALSALAGGVAFAGTAAAEQHDLTASDGAGGNASALVAGFDDQLPDGDESDDDTLRVEATNESLPADFQGELRVPDSEVSFADEQAFEVVVIGETGDERTTADDSVTVTHVGNDRIAFEVNDATLSSAPVAIEIRDLRFDAAAAETATLQWTVAGEEATHDLRVEPFDAELTATDENGGLSAAVTAGAKNQTMVGAATGTPNDPADSLVLRADEDELPSQFVATLSLDGSGITFHDRNNGDFDVSSSSGRAVVPTGGVSPTEIRVEVYELDGNSEDAAVIQLDDVTFDVPPNASIENVTWEISGRSDTYELLPDRPAVRFASSQAVPRGLDGAPSDGATVEISGQDAYTTGLHDGDENITVAIPDDRRENLSFDTTAETTAAIESDDDLFGSEAAATVEENRIVVAVDRDIDDSETVTLSNVRFDTSGFEGPADAAAADFESNLAVVTTPVDSGAFAPVETPTENVLTVGTPEITVEGDTTQLESGVAATNGTADIGVRIDDTTGHQIAPGSEVVVSLDGADGIDFDTTQTVTVNGSLSESVDVSATENAIVVSVAEDASPTAAGDSLVIEGADGDGLRFDTTDAATGDSASFSVETNAGDVPVVQSTDAVAAVSDPGLSVDRDTLALADGRTVTATVVDADGQPVEGADVSVTSDALGVDTTVTTGSDGTATVTLNLADADAVGTIGISTTVDGRQLSETVETADIGTNVSRLPAGQETAVGVTIETSADGAQQGVDVTATADGFEVDDGTATTGDDGVANFTFTPDAGGNISIDATVADATLEAGVTSVPPTMTAAPDSISAGNESTVEVTVEALDAPDGEMATRSGVAVNAVSDQYDIDREAETDEAGVATFTFNVSENTESGHIDLSATVDGIAVSDRVDVSGSKNDSNTGGDGDSVDDGDGDDGSGGGGGAGTGGSGGGSGAGGGGAPTQPSEDEETQEPAANITVTDAALSASELTVGESVNVTATVENDGEEAGEREVSVLVDGDAIATETVALDAGESGMVSATVVFETAGERAVSVGGVTAGTVVVADAGNETSDGEADAEPPAGAVAFDARGIDDTMPGRTGTAVAFENVTVERITFVEGADGRVAITEMAELPDGVPETPGDLLSVMEITVPENLSDAEATVRFTLNESELDAVGADPEAVRLGHYTDGDWEVYRPALVDTEGGELVYASSVPGFSLYAVYAADSEESTESDATEAPGTEAPVGEVASIVDSPVTVVLGFVGLVALVVSIAGARMYQRNDRF